MEPERAMLLIGLLIGWLGGTGFVYWLLRDPSQPRPPKPHRHNWIFTTCSDGVLRTCHECGESDATLFKNLPGVRTAAPDAGQGGARERHEQF